MVAQRRSTATSRAAAAAAATAPATAPATVPAVPQAAQPQVEAVQPTVQPSPVLGGATNPPMGSTELVLSWIGFDKAKQRNAVLEELGTDLSDFLQLAEKELDGLGKTLSNRTPATEKVAIGLQRMKKLKAIIHWARDRHRIDMPATIDPSVDTTEAKTTFLEELVSSTERHYIREQDRDFPREAEG
jgi:hypothetical protein